MTDLSQLADPQDYGNAPGDGPLRPKGQAPGETLTKSDLPSTRSKAADVQQSAVDLVRTLWAGNEAVRAKGRVLLPSGPGEESPEYTQRLNMSVFFNMFRRTVEGLVGLIFRKDPKLGDDVPVVIAEHWENIDMEGTHGDVFCREIATDALTVGHAVILVEYPNTAGEHGREAEITGEIRPYWVPIHKEDIMSWRTVKENGARILTQLVIREKTMVSEGRFGERSQTQYRVLYRENGVVGWELLEVSKDNAIISVDEGLYPTQDEVPVSEICSSGSKSLFESDPPLIDLAYLNIAHYQAWSDYAYSIHMANVPILFGKGIPEARNPDGTPTGPVVVGANAAFLTQAPDADMKYVSHDGAALGASKQNLDDLKADIGTLGLAMLSPQKRVAETAEAKRLDKSTSDSALSVTARALQDGVENALKFHGRYLRGQPEGGSIEINRDFEGLLLEADVMNAFSQLVKVGMPPEPVVRALIAGGRLPEDTDVDTFVMEWMMGQALNEQIPPPEPEEPEIEEIE